MDLLLMANRGQVYPTCPPGASIWGAAVAVRFAHGMSETNIMRLNASFPRTRPETPKQQYVRPELRSFGAIRKITRAVGANGAMDGTPSVKTQL
jgi:hypothetical protein